MTIIGARAILVIALSGILGVGPALANGAYDLPPGDCPSPADAIDQRGGVGLYPRHAGRGRFTSNGWDVARRAPGNARLGGDLLFPQSATPEPDFPERGDFVPGEILVKFRTNADIRAFLSQPFARTLDVLGGGDWQALELMLTPTALPLPPGYVLLTLDARDRQISDDRLRSLTSLLVETLRGLDEVELADPNYYFEQQALSENSCYDMQWHYWGQADPAHSSPGGIGVPDPDTIGPPESEVVVAVIDDGLSDRMLGLPTGLVVPGYNFFDGNYDTNTPKGDRWPHGTWVLSIIADIVSGGASNTGVRIQPIRVAGSRVARLDQIVTAIYWAVGIDPTLDWLRYSERRRQPALHPVAYPAAANPTPAQVINISLNHYVRTCPPALQAALDAAYQANALVVVAAGNQRLDVADYTPGNCEHVMTVGASDARGWLAPHYSNFGVGVDILAPGGDTDADMDGNFIRDGLVIAGPDNAKWFLDGTSGAAPHVAAVAALLLAHISCDRQTNGIASGSERPCPTPDEIQRMLIDASRPVPEDHCLSGPPRGVLNQVACGPMGPGYLLNATQLFAAIHAANGAQ